MASPQPSSGLAQRPTQPRRLPIARLRAFRVRGLNAGEKALARQIFGDALDYGRIRIVQLPRLTFGAAAPFRHTIYFSRWRAPADFTAASVREQAWFIHELAHLWQAKRGVPLPLAKLFALGRNAYRVPASTPFRRMNIEAQAETARWLFLARHGQADACPLSPDELEECWRR